MHNQATVHLRRQPYRGTAVGLTAVRMSIVALLADPPLTITVYWPSRHSTRTRHNTRAAADHHGPWLPSAPLPQSDASDATRITGGNVSYPLQQEARHASALTGRQAPDRRSLSVLWIAHDDISYHGLPALLSEVPAIGKAQVLHRVESAGSLAEDDQFDVWAIPLSSRVDTLGPVLPHQSGKPKLLITLPSEQRARLVQAIAQPADGYLLSTNLTVASLQDVFEKLANGEMPMPASMTRELISQRGRSGHPRSPGRLTERERAVLDLLVQGYGNQQIASSLEISIHGAKRHVSNLLVKFDCGNRTELALTAVELGIASKTQ